jgi:hypothetical protein
MFPAAADLQPAATESPAASSLGDAVTAAEPAPEELAAMMSGPAASAGAITAPTLRRPAGEGNRWFIPLVFVPLVLYAVGATFFIGWSIIKLNQMQEHQQQQNPFDKLPDDGDNQGVNKNGRRISQQLLYDSNFATQPLPQVQRLALGEKGRRFGELEVTPLRVERKPVRVIVAGFSRAEPCRHDSLVLTLKLRNVSADQAFAPLDNYFDRAWKPGMSLMPLTYLEAGKHRIFGPARWVPPEKRRDEYTEYVEGRALADPVGLKPGAEVEGQICTDGNSDEAARVLFGGPDAPPEPGPFLWRVRLRCGLIEWRGRERSATTVIGVEFARSQIVTDDNG